MIGLLLSAIWGFCMLLAFRGWGSLTARFVFPRQDAELGQMLAVGMALAVLVGGVMNLSSTISPIAAWAFLLAGMLLGAPELWRNRRRFPEALARALRSCRGDWVVAVSGTAICALTAALYLSSASSTSFNEHDDLQGYFVFPVKMLQTGSMGSDPFSERRVMTSLGGQSFLQTFALAARGFESLHLIDLGIGTLVMMALLAGLGARLHVPARARVLVLLVFLLTPVQAANITATLTASGLLLGLFSIALMESKDHRDQHRKLLAIGLIAGAACTMKSPVIPAVGVATALCFFFETTRSASRLRTTAWCLGGCMLAAAITVPWMISMYQSSGTFLYPILGKGYHGSAYGTFAGPATDLRLQLAVHSLLLAGSGAAAVVLALLTVVLARVWRLPNLLADPISIVIGGTGVGAVLTALASGGCATERYIFPILLPGVLVLLCRALALPRTTTFAGASAVTAAALCGVGLIGSGWNDSRQVYQHYGQTIVQAFRGARLVGPMDRAQMASVQAALPAGRTVLARVTKPFLFDFTRNRIFIADYPGGASPPPGMPSFQGEEALASYLLSHSIQYVVYSYGNEAKFRRQEYADRLGEDQHPWIRAEAEHTFDFQDNLLQLRSSRKKLYDDGEIVVLDLSSVERKSAS